MQFLIIDERYINWGQGEYREWIWKFNGGDCMISSLCQIIYLHYLVGEAISLILEPKSESTRLFQRYPMASYPPQGLELNSHDFSLMFQLTLYEMKRNQFGIVNQISQQKSLQFNFYDNIVSRTKRECSS